MTKQQQLRTLAQLGYTWTHTPSNKYVITSLVTPHGFHYEFSCTKEGRQRAKETIQNCYNYEIKEAMKGNVTF